MSLAITFLIKNIKYKCKNKKYTRKGHLKYKYMKYNYLFKIIDVFSYYTFNKKHKI